VVDDVEEGGKNFPTARRRSRVREKVQPLKKCLENREGVKKLFLVTSEPRCSDHALQIGGEKRG